MIFKLISTVLALFLVWLTYMRILQKDFSTVPAVLGGVLGFVLGNSIGLTAFGTATDGKWVFAALFFVIGGMVHFTDKRTK